MYAFPYKPEVVKKKKNSYMDLSFTKKCEKKVK